MVELGLEVPAFASISRNDLPNLEKICKKIDFLDYKNTSAQEAEEQKYSMNQIQKRWNELL